ncbi:MULTISPECIES: MotA/TolQ/ExbB proton channel family protein [Vibrio]|uniref:MotA/TolQ/ExbB proton channel family protein n=1 Tax=Vibrio TaxID=662 RepID=UPI0012636106|nr:MULTISPECIES: MotA/TolQ/ExbB proton channel family protein [Vibrio]EKO3855560.1 MotA/TolQ/ExbB proton channel family protein [Vibrio harveyi]EKO3860876.1 MotA/TolQ/ExbB proton channel family protein [Vibrio harveyi]MCQ9082662.1 MotA/TolQ/ExbB proton channel family protein [Vibrio harveyi]MDA0133958.1 MotA/TolQ/ExbB proton channel family protein [Vibrio sp. NFR]QFQ81067.1 MotA/TolQ/ExbB proton channel family protein [Vibrio harveyi]
MLEQVLAARLPMDHPIMWSIGLVSLVMWGLILHCYLRFHTLKSTDLNTQFSQKIKQYYGIQDNERLYLENGWLSEIRQHLSVGLNEIRLFVRILPMLGLLGTVDGMMTCFEQLNSDDVLNAVSEGISQAMLTTLAGLLAALSGMYLAYNLKRQQEKLLVHFANQWKSYEN